jgi:MFS family permease
MSTQAQQIADSPYAWWRLLVSLLLATIGGIGLWSVVVVLPTVEAAFGVTRGGASLPYMATMIGFAAGGVMMGRLSDRFGIRVPVMISGVVLCVGYVAASQAEALWQFIAAQALLIGMLGSSTTFGPLVADVTLWFRRRRGLAVAIVASGNYLAGTVWPPVLTWLMDLYGWRDTHVIIGVFCVATMLPLSLLLKKRAPLEDPIAATGPAMFGQMTAGLSPRALQALLVLAGLACCIAMSMPQVHIIAYCVDLGYGEANGAQMLSVMLGLGVVSRLASGLIADRIGGVGTLLLGSTLQCLALMFYLPFDGLTSLYVVSALFGLSQGGIVPSYALIVRDYFKASEAGTRVSLVLMSTVVGMAIGGFVSGAIYDWTQSYQAAFLNGIAFNLLNMSLALWLLLSRRRRDPQPA